MLGAVDHQELVASLRRVGLVAARAGGGDVRLEARGDELVLEARSGDLSVRTAVPLARPGIGQIVVPARYFERFVSSVSGAVQLDVRDDHLEVTAGRSRIRLRGVEAAWVAPQWPAVPVTPVSEADRFAISKVSHAAGQGIRAPILSAVRLGDGWAVASDGYRLASARVDASLPACLPPADVLQRLLDDAPGSVGLGSDGRTVVVESDDLSWMTPVVEGEYFPWQGLIPAPETTPEQLRARRAPLLEAVKRVERMGFGGGAPFPRVVLQPGGDDRVVVRAEDAEVGEIVDEIDGRLSMPSLAFNAAYLRGALEQYDGEVVTARAAGPTKAVVLEDEVSLQLVMPLRT